MSRIMMRVIKGGLAPADTYSTDMLRARNYRMNDIVAVDITKPKGERYVG